VTAFSDWWVAQDRVDAAVPAVEEAIELDLDPVMLTASAPTLPTTASGRWARMIAAALHADPASVAVHLREVWDVRDPDWTDRPTETADALNAAVRDLLVGCAEILGRDPVVLGRELAAEPAAA